MKLCILLALSLLTISVGSIGFGVNVKQLIATKQGGVIDQESLSHILQSQYNQHVIITNFFATGDIVANGKLTQYEFAQAYSAFMNFLFGQTPSDDLIAARWVIATWEQD